MLSIVTKIASRVTLHEQDIESFLYLRSLTSNWQCCYHTLRIQVTMFLNLKEKV